MNTYKSPPHAWVLLLLMLSLIASTAYAQPDRSDEKPENLQVLPESMTTQQVRRVMFQFTNALGVRCIHCHVGEEGQPLSTYDFASDDKESKEITRAMMRMVSAINNDHIHKLPDGESRLEVNCQTCHRGIPRPQLLEDVLADYLPDHGVEETLMYYETLREEFYGGFSYDFQEGTLNRLAQGLLGSGQAEEALEFLGLNADIYPRSANTYALMGEAYAALEDMPSAIKNYEKAVSLNPNNRRARERLDELKGEN